MFLTDAPKNIKDFLDSVNFLAPQGMSMKYFIVPFAAGSEDLHQQATQNGFEQVIDNQNVSGVTDTITYKKKDLGSRVSYAGTPPVVNNVPNSFPITQPGQQQQILQPMQQDMVISGMQMNSPIQSVKVVESTRFHKDILIKEAIGCFPKNTLFHFVKENV